MKLKEFDPLDYPLCFAPCDERFLCSAWIEHVPFAYALTQLMRPRTFVELGTYAGASYCAFCEAVMLLSLEARCFAVDTWHGDEHAGYYDDNVFQELRSYHDPRYGAFSQLLRETFDQAVEKFTDATIDLLHIDGLHTYEAVQHDFQTWLPKMSPRGVMLFHDISERSGDFGVWKLWEELSSHYPAFEFVHGHGLGVLCVGKNLSSAVEGLCRTSSERQQVLRTFYSSLGRHHTKDLSFSNLKKDVEEQRDYIRKQQEIIEDQQTHIESQKRNIEACQSQIDAKNEFIADLQTKVEDYRKEIEKFRVKLEDMNKQQQYLQNSYESSTSWKLTSPLRTISSWVRKRKGVP